MTNSLRQEQRQIVTYQSTQNLSSAAAETAYSFPEAYKRIIQTFFPRNAVHIFGSYYFGLADDDSDLNIYIEFGIIVTFLFDCKQN